MNEVSRISSNFREFDDEPYRCLEMLFAFNHVRRSQLHTIQTLQTQRAPLVQLDALAAALVKAGAKPGETTSFLASKCFSKQHFARFRLSLRRRLPAEFREK